MTMTFAYGHVQTNALQGLENSSCSRLSEVLPDVERIVISEKLISVYCTHNDSMGF